jgi:hypothetical protein
MKDHGWIFCILREHLIENVILLWKPIGINTYQLTCYIPNYGHDNSSHEKRKAFEEAFGCKSCSKDFAEH